MDLLACVTCLLEKFRIFLWFSDLQLYQTKTRFGYLLSLSLSLCFLIIFGSFDDTDVHHDQLCFSTLTKNFRNHLIPRMWPNSVPFSKDRRWVCLGSIWVIHISSCVDYSPLENICLFCENRMYTRQLLTDEAMPKAKHFISDLLIMSQQNFVLFLSGRYLYWLICCCVKFYFHDSGSVFLMVII